MMIREDLGLWKANTILRMDSIITERERTPLSGLVFSIIPPEVNIPCFYLFAITFGL